MMKNVVTVMKNVVTVMNRDDDNYEMPTKLGIKILEYIKEYIKQNKMPPTHSEIIDHVKHKGNGGVTYAINKLIKSGNLVKKGATRNLWPVD
jgi:SOS-response transcriptional repressor LexA